MHACIYVSGYYLSTWLTFYFRITLSFTVHLKSKMPVFSRVAVVFQVFALILSPVLAASITKEYDYVIVGGGITGLVVANRLSEDKSSQCHTPSYHFVC
jgi:uncharacterized membrane protein YgaE (UPF0421/DUF939 family)